MRRLKILLLSAYDASSHRYWRELLVSQLSDFEWTTITLPDRHFYWRIRSNALTYTLQHREALLADHDLIIATSMTDLCGLRGLLPTLGSIPTVLYFHENQFAYPVRKPGSNIINSQLVSVYSALCADRVLFNSKYNMQSFLSGATALFKKMPDGVSADVVTKIESVCDVLPVPIVAGASNEPRQRPTGKVLEIVWNHRWEYDKQPKVFFTAMKLLQERGIEFVLHVMGQSFREIPPCFTQAKETLGSRIVTWGYQSREAYEQILSRSDLVVSCAAHDFQGLGMLEAISYGCVPIAPARVAYPEYIPDALLYPGQIGSSDEPMLLVEKILSLLEGEWPAPPDVSSYYTENLLGKYDLLINELGEASR